jgi:hypothetical protein
MDVHYSKRRALIDFMGTSEGCLIFLKVVDAYDEI